VAALSSDTLGSRSTAIGYAALGSQNFTTATNTFNVAVGHAAGNNVSTGASNTLIGGNAGAAINVGFNNTALGHNAILALVDGDYNIAIGTNSLQADTKGNTSVAIGHGALQTQNFTTATDSFNVSVGYAAGSSVTTGVSNVLLGARAGSNVTTGGGNIIIGDSDGEAANIAHQIIMGNSVTGVGQDQFTFGRAALDSNIAFGATSITAPSDQRYKEDIADATAGLAFIKDLRPVTFKWKKEKDVPSDHPAYVEGSDTRVMNDYTNHGFIAQEVKTAIDAHSEIKDGFDMWSEQGSGGRQRLGPSSLVPMLVKAIQELEARIATLEG